MSKKKHDLTHTQKAGIVWFSVGLLLIAATVIFSRQPAYAVLQNDSLTATDAQFLDSLEDSIYTSRHHSNRPLHSAMQQQPSSEAVANAHLSHQPVKRKPLVVELNSADTLTLQLLNGIGPARARYIVDYRERLGGFRDIGQLLEVYSITPEVLQRIAPHLRLDSVALRRMPVNSIELKQLIKHPYVDYYFARDLVALRSRGAVFTSADDLRAIPSCNDTLLDRLLPYLVFD